MSGHRFLRLAAALVALGLGAATLASCAAPRDSLGPNESACYAAIPVAHAIAGRDAHFAGVRMFSLRHLEDAVAPGLGGFELTGAPGEPSCAVAWRGHFAAALDRNGTGPATGTWLLVVVSLARDRALASVVLERPPFWLSRLLPTTH